MATTTAQPVLIQAPAASNPLTRWHLLSLDAPTVASLWTYFIARCCGIHLPAATVTAMFFAVWLLYAADRLLDARTLSTPVRRSARSPATHTHSALEARHLFHHIHRARFATLILLALVIVAVLIPRLNPGAVQLFAAEGLLLAGWFTTLHATPFARHLPKELALGAFFAAAVYIPTFARLRTLPAHLVPGGVLFAAVCSLNCLFIHRWESPSSAQGAHLSTRIVARHTTPIAIAIILAGVVFTTPLYAPADAVPAASALAAALLLLLHRNRRRFHRTTLRAAADLALLTPLLLLPFVQ